MRHGAAVVPSAALRGQQLVVAAASGDDKLVASLLKVRRQSRSLVQHPCSRYHTLYHTTMLYPPGPYVAARLEVVPGALDWVQRPGRGAVYWAAAKGKTKVLDLLLQEGSCFESATQDGMTPYMAACSEGHADCVTLLLRRGCDTSRADATGLTGAQLAALRKKAAVAVAIAAHEAGDAVGVDLTRHRDVDVSSMLQAGGMLDWQVDVLRSQQEVAGLHHQMEKDARARALHQAKLQLEAEAEQARAGHKHKPLVTVHLEHKAPG